ncbi:MAG: hypothetical protein KDC54_14540, partial [Lewinella sp.]|nr:hypothetical protein [Lewinella sp.]
RIRQQKQLVGSPGLRLAGWTLFIIAIPHALLFFNWGLIAGGENRIPNGQIPMNSLVFLGAAVLMLTDAWNCHKS